jgi:hypothetical protein
VDDTRFWVVSARVSGSAVSGLGTLLSGAYVGMDVGKSDQPARRLSWRWTRRRSSTSTFPGRLFLLQAPTLGSIDVGTPVYFRRIEAARSPVSASTIQGKHIDMQIFIKAPYDRFVTADSRFWNASGVDVKLGAEGVQVNTESLTSIVAGGLAFLTPEDSFDASRRRRTRISRFPNPQRSAQAAHTRCSTISCASPSRCAACRWGRRWSSAASRWAKSPPSAPIPERQHRPGPAGRGGHLPRPHAAPPRGRPADPSARMTGTMISAHSSTA